MKLFFLALFFFMRKKSTLLLAIKKKKITPPAQQTYLYLHLWFFSLFSLSPFYVFFLSNQVGWQVLYIFPSPKCLLVLAPINSKRMSICMFKKSYTLKEKTYINFFFLSFTFNPKPNLMCATILLYHFFYIIVSTYKYNKLLLIWQKCLISCLIIFIYAFNGYFIINL